MLEWVGFNSFGLGCFSYCSTVSFEIRYYASTVLWAQSFTVLSGGFDSITLCIR